MKKHIFLVTIAILLFASCTNQLQSEKTDLTENTGVSVTLSYNIDGAFPVEILEKIQTASKVQRSAYPSLDSPYIYAYATDTLTITSETTKVEGQPVDGKNAFTIGNLTTGKTWFFTVELRDAANGGGNLLMSDSTSKLISEDDSILNHVFYLKPNATSGSGKIYLPIRCASSDDLEIIKIKAISKTPGWPYNSSTLFPSGTGDASLGTGTEWIPSGAYDVTLVFYNADDLAVYSETQTINIFKNMTTRIWRKNGSTATAVSNEGDFILANPLITSSARTQLYAGTPEGITANDLNIGTFASPFDSVQKAVDYIKYTGSNTKEYTINISGEQSGQVNMSHLNGKAKKIILRGTHNAGVNGNTTDVITAGLESSRTDGNTLRINTNFPVEIKNLTITGGKTSGSGGGIIITSGELILGQDTRITGNTASIFGGGILVQDDSVLKIESNVYIFGNTDGAETPVPSNLYLPSGKKIRITGPLSQGSGSSQKKAKIGITTAGAPTVVLPITFTQGYGFKAGGHNAGVLPGVYFRGDNFGVTHDGDEGTGEAVLAVSGGSISVDDIYEDITIAIDKTVTSTVSANKTFTFSATGVDAEGNDVAIPAGTGAGKASYSYSLTYHGETLPQSSGSLTYYTPGSGTDVNKVTLGASLPAGNYTINVTATYNGTSYGASFDINYIQPAEFTEAPVIEEPYVYFGDFPQTLKATSVIMLEDVTVNHCGFDCVLGSDGAWYTQFNSNYFKMEPIKWRILTYNYNGTGKTLLLAEKNLYRNVLFFDSTSTRTIESQSIKPNNYEHSRLRAYLNGLSYYKSSTEPDNADFENKGFLQSAFTAQAQAKIVVTEVLNASPCNNTNDKVFILSVDEYLRSDFFDTNNSRIRDLTDFSKKALQDSEYKISWTRTVSGNTRLIVSYSDGAVTSDHTYDVNRDFIGIVPAICIDFQ